MAVLTRSRAAAEGARRKSILRFPNEILSMVVEYSSTLELWALCRTSKRLRSIATPMLYRNIHLHAAEQTVLFIRTMQSQPLESSEPLWLRVQEFVIVNDNALVGATPQIIDDLNSVVIKMTKLKHLLLSSKAFIDFTPLRLLHDSNFPHLQTFRYVLHPTPSSKDSEEFLKFLARHRATLTTLHVDCGKPIPFTRSIDLPLLHTYDGPSWALKFLKKSVGSLRSVVLRWKEPDIDYRSPLKQLSKAHSIQTLEIVVDTFPGRLREPTILAAVAQSVPHVQILRFSRSALYGFSFDDLMPMRQHLSRFTALSELRFAIFRRESVSAVNDDLPILDAWLRVCGTLCMVHLDGLDWRLVDGEWIPSG
ncbi:hypothetical protein R3P38DRAFT_578440 [Favolaschia claudopus]|uniref:F-box domain-containing protein n=1 Tax=Favolaschia claudopus TaxID=2862362 RepID=A0AAV9Z9K8_9AGAR